MLVFNNNITNIYYFQRQLLVEAWDFNGVNNADDIIDRITIPMMEIGNELGPSNTHTISGEYGIGNFTLIYYNLTTEPTTCTSTHTTTVSNAIFNTFSSTAKGKLPTYT